MVLVVFEPPQCGLHLLVVDRVVDVWSAFGHGLVVADAFARAEGILMDCMVLVNLVYVVAAAFVAVLVRIFHWQRQQLEGREHHGLYL